VRKKPKNHGTSLSDSNLDRLLQNKTSFTLTQAKPILTYPTENKGIDVNIVPGERAIKGGGKGKKRKNWRHRKLLQNQKNTDHRNTTMMDIDEPHHPEAHQTQPQNDNNKNQTTKPRELLSHTIRAPPFSYAHLTSVSSTSEDQDQEEDQLDALQVRAYCTAALRQFLGDTGAGIPVDVLSVSGRDCWLRVPRPDLGAFAGAITAFPGLSSSTSMTILRIRASGDWLGSLIGQAEEQELWTC